MCKSRYRGRFALCTGCSSLATVLTLGNALSTALRLPKTAEIFNFWSPEVTWADPYIKEETLNISATSERIGVVSYTVLQLRLGAIDRRIKQAAPVPRSRARYPLEVPGPTCLTPLRRI